MTTQFSLPRRRIVPILICALVVADGWLIHAQDETRSGEWRSSGGDSAYRRYSPLAQITRDNVKNLRIVWRRPALDPRVKEEFPKLRTNNYLRATPTMIGGVLYTPDAAGLITALDAATGDVLWRQEPTPEMANEASATSTRGVDFWKGGADHRLFTVRNGYLYALDLRGKAVSRFGTDGRVTLLPEGARTFGWSSGPIVVGDVVVIAGNLDGAGDGGQKWKGSPPEDVRGFDARTGKLLWTFHVVPRDGEFGADTWGNGSGKLSGDLGSWCCVSADEALGYVYIPLTAPTAAYFGGFRPGDNLFSNALVALDAKTGKRVWHFQMVHHDLWEYDTVGPPTLGDITVEGRRIKAVMQPSKTGFLYVFDRATGTPVWPIEERPVPQSTVPGETTAPTQPFPTKPPPFAARIGVSEDDLIDFTPELRAQARELAKQFVLGPIFTPPSLVSDQPGGKQGTLALPGSWGSGNWNSGAFDPDTGYYYAFSHEIPRVYRIAKATDADAEMEYWSPNRDAPYIDGLPLIKPPYGRIVAIDLNRGEHAWTAVNGDGPRDHPLLKDLKLPALGIASRPTALVTKTLLFIGEGSNLFGGVHPTMFGRKFRAYDKATGQVIWETELPAGTTGGPMTYLAKGKQYIVIPIGGRDEPAEWVALALP